MNASTPAYRYLYQIEMRFWHIATPMMGQSRVLQAIIRFVYNVLIGKPWKWLVAMTSVSATIMWLVGYLLGIIIG